ncbi:MAG: triose-phosphate isomerase [Kofleriaceae bacterium]
MRTPFVVGNWKLHKTVAESLALVTELKNQLSAVKGVAAAVAPSFTSLAAVTKRLEDSPIGVAAQNCYFESKGAFTGEVSAPQLADLGCTWCIVGHSERRTIFGESSALVGKKTKAVLAAGLGAIVCVGETEAERDAHRTFDVLDEQLAGGLPPAGPLDAALHARLVIAYEPVWAIGTGRTATAAQAQEAHAHIRRRLQERFGAAAAAALRIQYGGSVKPGNAEALMAEPDIDGALVGGASLEAADFVAIVKAARPK